MSKQEDSPTVKRRSNRKVSFTVPDPNRKAFGNRLRLAMKGRHTNETLASDIKVSVSGIKKWLSGAADPAWSSVVEAATACNVSLDWLATGEGSMRVGEAAGAPVESTPAPALPTDHRLIGRLTEKIVILYKEMGFGIALHQAAERAAREHDRIVATVADPDERLIQIGEVIAELRQELRAKAADPSSSKQRA